MSIPRKMKAALQREASGDLFIEEVNVPIPGPGEVLVQMEYTPINPSDLSFLQGTYAEKPSYPVIPGIEGSGIVVATGSGILPKLRMGKRVSCTSTKGNGGAWAEYMLTSAMHVIPIGKLDFEQAAMLIVNPLTALSFIDIAKANKHKAIVNNAAAGALGKMINRLAQTAGIPCINIVRNKEQFDTLKSEGVEYILLNSDEGFILNYQELSTKLSASLILDPVGGNLSGELLRHAPKNSILMLYANLSESPISIDSRVLVQEDKQIQGFYLANYNSKKNLLKALSDTKRVQKLIGNELKTDIQKKFPLENINEALELYKKQMSIGKVLLNCKSK
jgi:NADPH:quinone reductase-like Zn-dependent oxidoreductase